VTEILLGPTLTDGPTTKVKDKTSGKTYYKKRILPEGSYDYKTPGGEKIKLDLTAGELQKFVSSFKEKAYDEVPFQFGKHDNDPTLRKGTLAHVEHIPGKGIEGYFELDSDAASYVEKYPNFGVSPRLVLDISRADGKKFPGAIQHVAGTVVPRMTGMGPWQKVELSEDGDTDDSTPVIDLSTETIKVEREGKVVTTPETTSGEGGQKVFTLSQEEYEFFKRQKAEFEEIMGSTKEEEKKVTSSVELSEDAKKAIADAKTAADNALAGLAAIKKDAAAAEWSAKKSLLLSQGVPPAALDLADPVMTAPEPQVYDLDTAEGTVKVSAKDQMLGQLELMKGMVPLGAEEGHGVSGVELSGDTETDLDAWIANQGL
jgi:hypothetical protein